MPVSTENPDISVLLPVFNAEATLKECIDSILNQTCENFELVVVEDHSTDSSVQVLNQYNDARIRVIKNQNKGLVSALNFGLEFCRANLVARMDADDIMRQERLSKQKQYLDDNVHVELVASQVRKFPEGMLQNGYKEYIRWQNTCISAEEINRQIYIESPFAHPTVMFRKDIVLSMGGYREGLFPEDYDLWLRMFYAGHVMEKIPEVLLDWRESDSRESRVSPRCTRDAFDSLRAEYLVKDSRLHNRSVAYWGAGRKTRQRSRLLIDKGIAPGVWIDIDPKKIGNVIEGARVEEPAWLEREDKPFVLNYVTNHGARDITRNYLERIGYVMGLDYLEVG